MEKKEIKKIIIVFLGVALLALLKDLSGGILQENNVIKRGDIGESAQEALFHLKIEGDKKAYPYGLEILPVKVTEEQAKEYFKEAKKEIRSQTEVDNGQVNIKESYVDDLVLAEWKFTPHGYIDSSGYIDREKMNEDKMLINATVTLVCGAYEDEFEYSISLEKNVSETEQVFSMIDEIVQKQMVKEGVDKIQLPENVGGKNLYWKEEKEYLVVKVLLLEISVIVLLIFLRKGEEREEKKKLKEKLEYEYPDIVNQLCVLLGAGMTTRQAWFRIAKQYQDKKSSVLMEENLLYESIVYMVHRLSEGETERVAYEKFAEEIDVPCFRRLMRALIVNMEKGSLGIYAYLEGEEKQAYETRLLRAKKMGEETSTKLLVPLMLQMILIMAVVLFPAMIGFMY